MWAMVIGSCLALVARHGDRLLSLVVISVVGSSSRLLFVQFSAPDLALTQISVEVVTTILLLLALNLLPRETPREIERPAKGAGRRHRGAAAASASRVIAYGSP